MYGGDPEKLLPTAAELTDRNQVRDQSYDARVQRALIRSFLVSRIFVNESKRFEPNDVLFWLRFMATYESPEREEGVSISREFMLHDWWRFIGAKRARITHGWLTLGLSSFALGISLWIGNGSEYDGVDLGIWTALGVGANRLAIGFFSLQAAIKDRMPSRVHLSRLRNPRMVPILLLSIVVGAFLGWIATSAYGHPYGLFLMLVFILTSVLLASSSPVSDVHGEMAENALVNDRNFTIAISLLFGAYAFLYFNPIYGDNFSVAFALMVVVGRLCASSYMRYISALIYGRIYFKLPLSLRSFLSWARHAGILRVSGAGYQFRHQELRQCLRQWAKPSD
jgi:hypothetical protein